MSDNDQLGSLLLAIGALLESVEEAAIARTLRNLAARWEDADNPESQREVVGRLLALYAGMGSFQDLVVQNANGLLPEQSRLEALRRALYAEAAKQIR